MRIKDPNVYFNEIDNSLVPNTLSQNGACIIGAFSGGQAFVPIVIDDKNINLFGKTNGQFYAPYALNSYMLHSNKAPVVIRTLWNETYTKKTFNIIDDGDVLLATLITKPNETGSVTVSGSNVVYSGSVQIEASLDKTKPNAMDKVFSTNPKGKQPVYLYFYDNSATDGESVKEATLNFNQGYTNAKSPFLKDVANNDLFKIHTISDGICGNEQVKIIISNIRKGTNSQYATFSLTVRSFNDTDNNPIVLQRYTNLNLNINDPNYIGRVIGDQKVVFDYANKNIVNQGNYKNNSSYIRIEVSDMVENGTISTLAYPYQYQIKSLPVSEEVDDTNFFILDNKKDGIINKKIVFGYDYNSIKAKVLFNEIPTVGNEIDLSFKLSDITDQEILSEEYFKFNVPLYGGSDGIDPATDFSDVSTSKFNGFDLSTIESVGTKAFDIALDLISNKELVDIDIITIPGINVAGSIGHTYLINKAIDIAQQRQDCVALFDGDNIANTKTQDQLVEIMDDYDNSYMGVYYPAIKVYDINLQRYIWLPSICQVLGAYAYNDKIGQYWLAPAGFNRAALDSVKEVKVRLNQDQRAKLYNSRINPIALFPNLGYVVWGQKTTQKKETALNRINVRRLVIRIKRFINTLGLGLLFEPNTQVLWQKFLKELRPYLRTIVQLQGLYAYDVIMDSTTNTPDMIDRNILSGQVIIQPTKAVQYIAIDFVINRTQSE